MIVKREFLHSFVLSIILFLCVRQSYDGTSYGLLDLIIIFIAFFLIIKAANSKLKTDLIINVLIFQVILALLTITVFRLTDSSWFNIYRSLTYSLIIYTYVYNYITYKYSNVIILTCILLSFFNLNVLVDGWERGFIHYSLDLAYYNLNNIGFMSLLMLCCSLCFYFSSLKSRITFLLTSMLSMLSILIILLSFSRSNYLLMLLVILYAGIFVFKVRQLIIFVILISFFVVFISTYWIESNFIDGFYFLEKKATVDTVSNIIYGRFNDVIFKPIKSYFDNRYFLAFILGGEPVPAHSLIVTYMTSFGIISMFFYLYLNYRMVFMGSKLDFSSKIASLMIFILFLNDASTNTSTYILFMKLLPISIFAINRNNIK